MAIRIYALAKELQIDSKELVDICTKAGITGKGSALASLDDDELAKLKAFISGPKPSRAAAPAAAVTATATPAPPAPPAASQQPATADTSGFTREDYQPVATGGGAKMRQLGGRAKAKTAEPGETDRKQPPRERAPVIRLAPAPDVKQPSPTAKSNEPPPQKPDLRLPQDAIASAKMGARAPLEHLTAKVEKKKKERDKDREKEKPKTEVAATTETAARPLKGRGRRPATKEEEEVDSSLAGMASARADRQKSRRTRQRERDVPADRDDEQSAAARRRLARRKGSSTTAPRKGRVTIQLPCTVRQFSEETGIASSKILAILMKLGMMVNINAQIDPKLVELLAAELGIEAEVKQPESFEESILQEIRTREDDPELLVPRAPVVTFLGHVDHGKTSLLDYLVGTNVVSREAGGITQHIRAYQIRTDQGRDVSFVDTPGHEAFTEMRARGANVTDIAVLVIAADDGIMPQTEEAISHAQAAEVPIVVACNKIDLPAANPNRLLTQLTEHGLTPSEWGGDVEVVRTSAVNGEGMSDLLETLLTIAELNDFRANPDRPAMGVCLESEQAGTHGVLAKVIVQEGTLRVGDIVVCGSAHGRIKAMYDTLNTQQRVQEAGPSRPVNIAGFDKAPEAGESFYVLDDISVARQIADSRAAQTRAENLSTTTTKVSFERFQELLSEGRLGPNEEVVTLNLIVRADTRGSIEAIVKEFDKLEHPEVQIKILLKGVGGITVGDVHLADASQAVIVGFNVTPDEAARQLADEKSVQIRRYDIIYKLTDDLKAMLEGKLKPEERVVDLGRAVVLQVFPISRVGTVAGCRVVQGTIERGCRMRLFREGRNIGDYPLDSLRREKDDTREVRSGMECGIKLAGFNDVKKDDILEAYKIEEFARTL